MVVAEHPVYVVKTFGVQSLYGVAWPLVVLNPTSTGIHLAGGMHTPIVTITWMQGRAIVSDQENDQATERYNLAMWKLDTSQ